jgi:hypothetical protein
MDFWSSRFGAFAQQTSNFRTEVIVEPAASATASSAQVWGEHLISYSAGSTDELKKQWIADEEKFRRSVLNQLMELYQAGSQTASSVA